MTSSFGIAPGVDRAAFAAALARKLQGAGASVDLGAQAALIEALAVTGTPSTRDELYWTARVTLVRRHADLPRFDAVFDVVFADAVLPMDPIARRNPTPPVRKAERLSPDSGEQDGGGGSSGLPWLTRGSVHGDDHDGGDARSAEPLPSAVAALADVPFDRLAPEQLALLQHWLDDALPRWPSRPSRRRRPHPRGRTIDLRATLSRARSTGGHPTRLVRTRPVRRRRRLLVLADVSRSMQPYTAVYLHLMSAAVLRADAEVYAFGTGLTRLTPVMGDRAVPDPVAHAASKVDDRGGGTRIGHSLATFLDSHRGGLARGAVVMIASDGWDADPPAGLARAMARLHRRAHRVVWVNPRCAAPGFAPTTGAMSAALPHVDALLPGHTLRALQDVVAALSAQGAR